MDLAGTTACGATFGGRGGGPAHVCMLEGGHAGPHSTMAWRLALGNRPPRCAATLARSDFWPTLECMRATGHDGQHRSEGGMSWADEAPPVPPICGRSQGGCTDPTCRCRCMLPEGHKGAHGSAHAASWSDEPAPSVPQGLDGAARMLSESRERVVELERRLEEAEARRESISHAELARFVQEAADQRARAERAEAWARRWKDAATVMRRCYGEAVKRGCNERDFWKREAWSRLGALEAELVELRAARADWKRLAQKLGAERDRLRALNDGPLREVVAHLDGRGSPTDDWRAEARLIHEEAPKQGYAAWSERDKHLLLLGLLGQAGKLAALENKAQRNGLGQAGVLWRDLADVRVYLYLVAVAYGVDEDAAVRRRLPELYDKFGVSRVDEDATAG